MFESVKVPYWGLAKSVERLWVTCILANRFIGDYWSFGRLPDLRNTCSAS